MERRKALSDFLRGRRARMEPRTLGITPGPRRRTPGLRREELAQRAGVSVDWYVRLEQGRDVTPSRATLDAIAGALRLDDDERGHLFFLARAEGPPRRLQRVEEIDEALARALPLLRETPGLILGRRHDLLAWNRALCRLFGLEVEEIAPARRNVLWLLFCEPRMRARYAAWPEVANAAVAGFRAVWAKHAEDPDFEALVTALLDASPEFATVWARHDVHAKTGGTKAFVTEVGRLELEYHTLIGARNPDQRLVFFTAAPGGPAEPLLGRLINS